MPDDLDAFLQKAAQKRKKKKQPGIVILDADEAPPAPPPRAPLAASDSKPLPSAPPKKPQPVPTVGTSTSAREERAAKARDVASHVDIHLDAGEFQKRTSQLGERVGMADDDMDAHLQQVFDHRVGSLAYTEEASRGPAATTPDDVRAMFMTPSDIRRAIILNEILNPPSFDR